MRPTENAASSSALGLVVFVILTGAALGWIHTDLRPAPLYDTHYTHASAAAVFVTWKYPLELTFDLPREAERVRVPVWTEPGRDPLDLVLRDERGNVLDEASAVRTGQVVLELGPDAASVRGLTLSATSIAGERERSPRLLWAESPPHHGARVRYGGSPVVGFEAVPDTGPLLWVEYPWPSRVLLLLWTLPLGLAFAAWRDPRRLPWLWVALSLAASVTSALLWQQDYTRQIEHLDADRYAESARQLARFAIDPEAREAVRAWYRSYPHASTPLVQALVAVPVLAGVPSALAYLWLSALAGFAALLVFVRMLSVELGCKPRSVLLAGIGFVCHVAMLRAFARPVSDGVGLLLVMLTLWLLVRRIQGTGRHDTAWLAGVLLLHALARPQGLAYWIFVALVIVLVDGRRAGGSFDWRAAATSGLRLFSPPLAILAVLYLGFGWLHNVDLMLQKAARFRVNSTAAFYLQSLVGLLQLQPLLWIRSGLRLREPAVALSLGWIGFCLLLLVAVRAPFWLRHFLPILPAVFVLSALAVDRAEGRRARVLGVALMLFAVLNLSAAFYQLDTTGPLDTAIAGFITDP